MPGYCAMSSASTGTLIDCRADRLTFGKPEEVQSGAAPSPKAACVTFTLLPAASQRLIQLYEGVQLVALGLRQGKFCRKRIGLVGQYFQIVASAGFEAYFRESRGALRRIHKVFLLDAKFPVLPIRHRK